MNRRGGFLSLRTKSLRAESVALNTNLRIAEASNAPSSRVFSQLPLNSCANRLGNAEVHSGGFVSVVTPKFCSSLV